MKHPGACTFITFTALFLWLWHVPSVFAQPLTTSAQDTEQITESLTSVDQLSDVLPTSWAYSAVQSLVEQYQCIEGQPDQQFNGERSLSRQEFAAAIAACLDRLSTLEGLPRKDLAIAQRLQTEFASELTLLRNRVDRSDLQTTNLEAQPFSTTTRLTGLAIFAVNAGGSSEAQTISPRGAIVTGDQPNPTALYRFSVDLNTSFTGTDLLKLRMLTASPGANDNAAGLLEPNLGSTLDFSVPGTSQLALGRLYYAFTPTPDLRVTLGARMVAADVVDQNRYANVSFRDFSTQALVNNFVLLPRPAGTGAAIDWNPNQGALSLRAVYIASSASRTLPDNQQFFGGSSPEDIRLFPTGGGGARGGLFGDPYMGVLELEYAPTTSLTMRLQYSGGSVLGSNFQAVGANFDWAIAPRLGIFGRYGYASYPDTTVGNILPSYWSAGIVLQDIMTKGDLVGLGAAQPFILREVGNATQTNFEVFYNLPITDNIRITPLIQVITDPANQSSNGTIVTGTIRTVFSF